MNKYLGQQVRLGLEHTFISRALHPVANKQLRFLHQPSTIDIWVAI
jgi:hypothetical protein